jgi:hypothetical protein
VCNDNGTPVCNTVRRFSTCLLKKSLFDNKLGGQRGQYSMPGKKVDFDVVRKIALALPEVEESTIHGTPSLKVRGRLLTCPAIHRSAEPDTLAVRMDFDQRAKLLAAEPGVYYVPDHYVNYPTVLVRLSRIDRTSLKQLLRLAWQFVSAKSQVGRRRGQGRAAD